MKAVDFTPQRIAMLEVRLVDRLEFAGGEMQRNDLREALRANLTSVQFDRIVTPLIARGEVACEKAIVKCVFFDGRSFDRECTVYRLVTSTSKKPERRS